MRKIVMELWLLKYQCIILYNGTLYTNDIIIIIVRECVCVNINYNNNNIMREEGVQRPFQAKM